VLPATRQLRTVLLRLSLVAVLAVGASACGDDDPTPEEARLQRVEDRLKASFTDEQVECMLEGFDDAVLASLDGTDTLPEDEAGFKQFQTVTQQCILESGDSPVTTAAPEGTSPEAEPEPEPEGDEADGTSSTVAGDASETTDGDPEAGSDTTVPAGDEDDGGDGADGSQPDPDGSAG